MKSMTGYAKAILENDDFDIELNLSSLNSRYLDLKIKLPKICYHLENDIRNYISKLIKRGKINVNINIKNKKQVDLEINKNRVLTYKKLYEDLSEIIGNKKQSCMNYILQREDIFEEEKTDDSKLLNSIISTIDKAILIFDENVTKEGMNMKLFFEDSINTISSNLKIIESKFPDYKAKVFNRIKENIEELIEEFIAEDEHDRLLRETAYYIERADITEEIIRLKSHINHFKDLLAEENKSVGKPLKFLIQEMHREANTIGSKFNDETVSKNIMVIKEEIDKCKEMVFNVR